MGLRTSHVLAVLLCLFQREDRRLGAGPLCGARELKNHSIGVPPLGPDRTSFSWGPRCRGAAWGPGPILPEAVITRLGRRITPEPELGAIGDAGGMVWSRSLRVIQSGPAACGDGAGVGTPDDRYPGISAPVDCSVRQSRPALPEFAERLIPNTNHPAAVFTAQEPWVQWGPAAEIDDRRVRLQRDGGSIGSPIYPHSAQRNIRDTTHSAGPGL